MSEVHIVSAFQCALEIGRDIAIRQHAFFSLKFSHALCFTEQVPLDLIQEMFTVFVVERAKHTLQCFAVLLYKPYEVMFQCCSCVLISFIQRVSFVYANQLCCIPLY